MGQVPLKNYTLIGNGRVATHFKQYLSLLSIPCFQWARKTHTIDQLKDFVNQSDILLLLIKDDAIDSFFNGHPFLWNKPVIHFSGSQVIENCPGVHPLMTFGPELYDLETYQKISFITEKGEATFQELFPRLPNVSHSIEKKDKILYHALCVLAGNFSMLLWRKFFQDFENKLGLPREIAFPYMDQVTKNMKRKGESPLTGPLVRNDISTIEKHLNVLQGDHYQNVYKAFVEAYQAEQIK